MLSTTRIYRSASGVRKIQPLHEGGRLLGYEGQKRCEFHLIFNVLSARFFPGELPSGIAEETSEYHFCRMR